MNRKDIILVLIVLVVLLWMTLLVMPRRYAYIDDLNGSYYDKQMASQDFMIRKKLKELKANDKVSDEEKLDLSESLAKTLWATFKWKEAAAMLTDILASREKLNPQYNQKSINTMIALAGVYRDLNKLNKSFDLYKKVLLLDKANLPIGDSRITRDENNLAMSDYLHGDCEKNAIRRQRYFEDAIGRTQKAIQSWHKEKDPDNALLANIFYLQYLCYRDMGDIPASNKAFKKMEFLNKKFKRAYSIPLR